MPRPTDPPAAFSYDPELTPGYFIQIRSDFLRSPAFSVYAKVLYEVLLTYAGEGATAWPGQLRLAEHLDVTDKTIRKVLTTELIPAGLVSMHRHGQGRPNSYHLHKLQTLPPKSRTVRRTVQERTRVPFKSGTARRSTAEPPTEKVESDQIQAEEEHASSPRGPSAFDLNPGYAERMRRR